MLPVPLFALVRKLTTVITTAIARELTGFV